MRQEEKVRLIVGCLFILLILNSIIIFGTAKDTFFGKEDKNSKEIEKTKNYLSERDYSNQIKDYPKRDYFYEGLVIKKDCYLEDCNEYSYFKGCNYYDEKRILKGDCWREIEYPKRKYFSRGEYVQSSTPLGYANDYKIYLKNNGKSDYFTVFVYLKTDEGIKEYRFRRYVFSGDEEVFMFRELSKTKNKFKDWSYKIEN